MDKLQSEQTEEEKKVSVPTKKDTTIGCFLFFGLIAIAIALFALIVIAPYLVTEKFVRTPDTLAFSSDSTTKFLVYTFNTFWIFFTFYWVKSLKRFAILLIIPLLTYSLLFFNYKLITLEGIYENPYFQITPSLITWEETQQVDFVPAVRKSKRDRDFEIRIAYLKDEEWHWVKDIYFHEHQKLKMELEKQNKVDVFIDPLTEGPLYLLEEQKEDDEEYYKEILTFLEIEDIKNYPKEQIKVN